MELNLLIFLFSLLTVQVFAGADYFTGTPSDPADPVGFFHDFPFRSVCPHHPFLANGYGSIRHERMSFQINWPNAKTDVRCDTKVIPAHCTAIIYTPSNRWSKTAQEYATLEYTKDTRSLDGVPEYIYKSMYWGSWVRLFPFFFGKLDRLANGSGWERWQRWQELVFEV